MFRKQLHIPFAVLLLLGWAAASAMLLWLFGADVGKIFNDPDDAMRLVEVRELLNGRGWFDLTELRLNSPEGYLTHWSRLIDAGLGGLYLLLRTMTDAPVAERLMMTFWPLLWLLPAMGSVAAIAWRCGGRDAAVIALALSVFGLPAFQQFAPGRIDHHNAQVVLALLAVAAAAWSDRKPFAAPVAGLLSALALAIGLESLPWIVLAGAAIIAGYVAGVNGSIVLRRYGLALAAGAGVVFFISVPPDRWLVDACDAIAINTAGPAIAVGIVCAVAGKMFDAAPWQGRVAVAAVCVLIAVVLFISAGPYCLGGPFAEIDSETKRIWLSQVREMAPLPRVLSQTPSLGVWVSAFPLVAVVGAVALLFNRKMRTDFGFLIALAALAIAAAATITVIKAYSYAMWFGIPLVAVAALQLATLIGARGVRWLAAAVMTPALVTGGAMAFTRPADPELRQNCFRPENFQPLAILSPGLVATEVDFGPHVLAFTSHSVVAAPYHRISPRIIEVMRLFEAPLDKAQLMLAALAADYLMICNTKRLAGAAGLSDRSLWSRLHAGDVPDWLDLVDGPADRAFFIYRIKR